MEYSDEFLVKGIKAGDDNAMELLVRRWYPRIYAYTLKMFGNEQDAYDVTQDTFISMIQAVKEFRPWKKYKSWIFTIAHNKCMDFFRLRGRLLLDDTEALERQAALDINELLINSALIESALEKLSVEQRETIVLHYYQEFSIREIAEMTNTAVPTIKSRLSAAKKKLADLLREDFI